MCDTNTDWKHRAETAEARCAEMRAVIETHIKHPNWEFSVACGAEHALSTDCGTGWLSPDKANDLLHDHNAMASNLAAFCKQLDAGDPGQAMAMLISMKEREKLLVEALERIHRIAKEVSQVTALPTEMQQIADVANQALDDVKPTL